MENQNEIKSRMPGSVITVLISAGIFVLALFGSAVLNGKPTSNIGQLIIWALLLFFFAKGGRISRIILIIYLVMSVIGVLAAVIVPAMTNKEFNAVIFLFLLALLAPLIIALTAILKKSAAQYAGFYCPSCGSGKVKSANFTYTKMVCKDCGKEWE